jgi:UDP-N-acetylmuramoylalanine--D-glutamate ligase
MTLAGKHVAILGAGRSGRAAAALALREGAHVSAWDGAGPEALQEMPPQVILHPYATTEHGRELVCDLLVVSPGIDTYGPYVAAFASHASEVIGEVEFAARYYNGRIIGITGTNGKTTTTELVARILGHAGMGGTACGNYGIPFAEIVLQDHPPATVALELSSFQLETIRTLHPEVAVWLNFAPDHMDRYPSVEAYFNAKSRIFENLGSADTAVIRVGESLPPLAARIVGFSTLDKSAAWYSNGRSIFHNGKIILDLVQDTRLRGIHNAENIMAALAACQTFGIALPLMCQALHDYSPPPHRCELIRTLHDVEYLNDSKATNLHALESALRSQTRPVVLLAGGKDKGLDYSSVLPLLRDKAVACVTFGQIAEPLMKLFSGAVSSRAVSTLADAVSLARDLAPPGSTVLLSPGTSSFDQFSGYEQRGNTFRNLVNQLN